MATLEDILSGDIPDNLTVSELAAIYAEAENQDRTDNTAFFLIIMGMVVFLMQAGFGLLEAGAVRAKNTTNILLKNFFDSCFGAMAYFAVGYAFSYGAFEFREDGSVNPDNGFISAGNFFLSNVDTMDYATWFFQFVFAATAATIVSGAVAERTSFYAYIIYSFVITGFVYPVVCHWTWDSRGWLAQRGYMDYAGSSIVHAVGGAAALVGAIVVGPRMGRFDANGNPVPIPGHSTVLSALGAFILWFGFLAFNGGSELQISDGSGQVVARVITNTILSGAAGAVTALIIAYLLNRKFSLLLSINGNLAGMVAICAGVNAVQPWAAVVIGSFAAVVYFAWSIILLKLKVDDPLDAVAVHLGAGIWGTLAAPMFTTDSEVGIFYGGKFSAFGVNVYGCVVIIAWTIALMLPLFGLLRLVGLLRASPQEELEGFDILKHAEPAYPYHTFNEEGKMERSPSDVNKIDMTEQKSIPEEDKSRSSEEEKKDIKSSDNLSPA